MTPDLIDLGRRAVATGRLPTPMPDGLVVSNRTTWFRDKARGILWVDVAPKDAAAPEWLPDLDDAATKGVLLALVREAWGDPNRMPFFDEDTTSQGSWCWSDGRDGWWSGDTLEACLVAALEAAPEAP